MNSITFLFYKKPDLSYLKDNVFSLIKKDFDDLKTPNSFFFEFLIVLDSYRIRINTHYNAFDNGKGFSFTYNCIRFKWLNEEKTTKIRVIDGVKDFSSVPEIHGLSEVIIDIDIEYVSYPSIDALIDAMCKFIYLIARYEQLSAFK